MLANIDKGYKGFHISYKDDHIDKKDDHADQDDPVDKDDSVDQDDHVDQKAYQGAYRLCEHSQRVRGSLLILCIGFVFGILWVIAGWAGGESLFDPATPEAEILRKERVALSIELAESPTMVRRFSFLNDPKEVAEEDYLLPAAFKGESEFWQIVGEAIDESFEQGKPLYIQKFALDSSILTICAEQITVPHVSPYVPSLSTFKTPNALYEYLGKAFRQKIIMFARHLEQQREKEKMMKLYM
jgi:hypothetical protein